MRKRTCLLVLAVVVMLGWLGHRAAVQAQAAAAAAKSPSGAAAPAAKAPADGDAGQSTETFWEIVFSSPVSLLIILLSIAAVALVVEHVMTIRSAVLMPPGLGEDVRRMLAMGNLAAADERCRMEPSFLAYVLGAGLAEADGGWPEVEKAMEDATAEQSARLFRKIEYLSLIGNIAPMLGLLGTVIGMILAFKKVATTEGAARAADLAGGIYLALVTTVEGLIVAIPALGAFAVFRNRVDQLAAEVAYTAQHVFAPLKRRRSPSRPKMPELPKAPPPPPPAGKG